MVLGSPCKKAFPSPKGVMRTACLSQPILICLPSQAQKTPSSLVSCLAQWGFLNTSHLPVLKGAGFSVVPGSRDWHPSLLPAFPLLPLPTTVPRSALSTTAFPLPKSPFKWPWKLRILFLPFCVENPISHAVPLHRFPPWCEAKLIWTRRCRSSQLLTVLLPFSREGAHQNIRKILGSLRTVTCPCVSWFPEGFLNCKSAMLFYLTVLPTQGNCIVLFKTLFQQCLLHYCFDSQTSCCGSILCRTLCTDTCLTIQLASNNKILCVHRSKCQLSKKSRGQ